MTTAKNIYDFINGFAPFETQMHFDNAGLLIGSENTLSHTVILSLDLTSDVIKEAVQKNAKIIITHHPVIFNPLKSILSEIAVFKCIQNNITVISAHTNLDIAKNGVNEALADYAGVTADEYFNDDCMIFGHLEKPAQCKTLADSLKRNISGLRYTDTGMIQKIAVSCGAGGGNIFLAKKCGADGFITGEIKHHEIIFANENNIAVFDLGHFNSENLIIPRLSKMLSDNFPDTAFLPSETFSDKLIYVKGEFQ